MAYNIYLDNSTTTRPSEKAVAKMLPFLTSHWGSPLAPHQMGQQLFPAIAESLRNIYAMLEAKESDDFVFTSSGAEAVNHAIFSSYQDITRITGKNQFITSNTEEAPPLMAIGRLEQWGCVGKMVNISKNGHVTPESIADSITARTAMVSLSWADGLTGVINPVAEIGKLCQERGIRFHLDATHILGKLFFNLEEVGVDFLTFNGDHLHAPKGTGGLFIKGGIPCSPFILGGFEQAGHRAGSYSIALLAALGVSSSEVHESRDLLCIETARLRNKLENGIKKGFPDAVLFFTDQERVPNISAIAFPGIANELMLFALNRKGVYAGIGGGNFQQIGLVLKGSGVDETLANTAVSFSLSRETSDEDVDRAVAIISETATRLRKLSREIIT